MLKDINIKNEYRSLHDNIPKDFYIPLLGESIMYKRSVGYFSSKVLISISYGIEKMIQNGGIIRLICSPNLDHEDILAINSGYQKRISETIEKKMLAEVREPENEFEEERLNYLAHLISDNKLDIKVALSYNKGKFGLYHEKLGLFYDKDSNIVAFSGSMNETYNAVSENYEAIDVFKSWSDTDGRVLQKEKAFDALWDNIDEAAYVLTFPNAVKEKIVSYKKENINFRILSESTNEYLKHCINHKLNLLTEKFPRIDNTISFRDYQNHAIEEWKSNNYIGIFDMATGTGKTYTGLKAVVELYNNNNKRLAVVIVCPFMHLVEQWVVDIKRFGMWPIIAYSESIHKNWKAKLKQNVRLFNEKILNHFCLVTTNITYCSEFVQEEIKKIQQDIVLVIDEAHNFGAQNFSKGLIEQIPFRLALSATIDRYGDIKGTNKLYNYFGKKCIEYTLKDAIDNGMLTPYKYYPLIVYFDEDELEEYIELTIKIRKISNFSESYEELNDIAKRILIKRARIVAGARQKLESLRKAIEPLKNQDHILVYCGATNVSDIDYKENEVTASEKRQLELVLNILGNELGMKVHEYTSKESKEERAMITDAFIDVNPYQALVAIRCLDEGVNIPSIKTAFIMASSTNPKEYIQRRGRVLRKAKGKLFATIYDFIVLPFDLKKCINISQNEIELTKGLVKREIERMEDFVSIAQNPFESDDIIYKAKKIFNI